MWNMKETTPVIRFRWCVTSHEAQGPGHLRGQVDGRYPTRTGPRAVVGSVPALKATRINTWVVAPLEWPPDVLDCAVGTTAACTAIRLIGGCFIMCHWSGAKLIVKLLPASDPISRIRWPMDWSVLTVGATLVGAGYGSSGTCRPSRCDCHLPHLQRTRTESDGQFHILAAAGTGQVAFSDRIKRSKGPKATPSPWIRNWWTDRRGWRTRGVPYNPANYRQQAVRENEVHSSAPSDARRTPSLGPRVLCISQNSNENKIKTDENATSGSVFRPKS